MLLRILFYILIPLTLASGTKQLTSPSETEALLEEIKDTAIVLGHGAKEVHSFIDPRCSMSQRYLSHIFKNRDKMFKRYTIYLYLYELKRKHTANVIRAIFESEYPDILIKSLMVDKTTPFDELDEDDLFDDETEERVEVIEDTANKIGVYKRPYIITNGRGK